MNLMHPSFGRANSIGSGLSGMDTEHWSVVSTNPNDLVGSPVTPNDVVTGATTTLTSIVSERIPSEIDEGGVSWLRLIYSNYRDNEVAVGNSITIRARILIEGLYAPLDVTFGGQTEKVLADLSAAISDPVDVGWLPSGTRYRVICTYTVANAAHKVPGGFRTISGATDNHPELGEGIWAGAWTNRDSIVLASTLNTYSHSAIIGVCTCKSIGVVGDSIFAGTGGQGLRQGHDGPATRWALQQFEPAFNTNTVPKYGFVEVAKGGEGLLDVLRGNGFRLRGFISSFCSTICCNMATNDLGVSSIAQVKADAVEFTKLFTNRGQKVIYFPILPRTTSTNAFITSGTNQTLAGAVADRQTFLAWQRDPAGYIAECEDAGIPSDMVMMITDRDAWACDAAGNPDSAGHYWLANAAVVSTGTINTATQIGTATFRDTTKASRTQNIDRARVVVMDPTAVGNPNKGASIRYNNTLGTYGFSAFQNTHVLNDPYKVYTGIFTEDGTHPSSHGSAIMAQTFDDAWLV